MNILELSEQEIGRRESLQQLRDMGIEPYPAAEYVVDAWSDEIRDNFVDLPTEKDAEGNLVYRKETRQERGINDQTVLVADVFAKWKKQEGIAW